MLQGHISLLSLTTLNLRAVSYLAKDYVSDSFCSAFWVIYPLFFEVVQAILLDRSEISSRLHCMHDKIVLLCRVEKEQRTLLPENPLHRTCTHVRLTLYGVYRRYRNMPTLFCRHSVRYTAYIHTQSSSRSVLESSTDSFAAELAKKILDIAHIFKIGVHQVFSTRLLNVLANAECVSIERKS